VRAATYKLAFSDEFNEASRTFANGEDTRWTALNIGDTSNKGTAFYLPEQVTIATDTNVTGPPVTALLISTIPEPHTGDSPTGEKGIFMPYKSAMLQTWNKFCFTGGIVEYRARQPRGGGYWPALWLFGNLGRAVYQNSNTGLWPWSYDKCDADLVLPPTDPPQRISACDDHDLEKDGLHGFQGRGATELDVLEGAVTNTGKESYCVGSLQLSPGIPPYFRPPSFGFPAASGSGSWYTELVFGTGGTSHTDGFANNGWYGPPWGSDCPTGCPDALSGGLVNLDDLDTRYWTYRMHWETGPSGHLSWYYDGAFVWSMSAHSFGAYSVCSQRGGKKECQRTPARQIPEEPMSLVMNTAIGTWNGGQTALDNLHWPAQFYIDYVRVWQRETNVGCNPPDYPTRAYIDKNHEWYGEVVLPSGYDTCPEEYPLSAHANARRITARAEAARAHIRAGGSAYTFNAAVAEAAAFLDAAPSEAPAAASAPRTDRGATGGALNLQFLNRLGFGRSGASGEAAAATGSAAVPPVDKMASTPAPPTTSTRAVLLSALPMLGVGLLVAAIAARSIVRVKQASTYAPTEVEYEDYVVRARP
jgi:callose synthase